ncbi:MAG: hypothetical protein V1822_03105, partial [Candidatus Micrarchaeota archaeon]
QVPQFIGGSLNPQWLKLVGEKISNASIAQMLDYPRRGEWAARNYMTAFYSVPNELNVDSEKLKINALRQHFSAQFDGGFMTLYRNSQTKIARTYMTYEGMKALCEFYTGKPWSAEGYEQWKANGATFGQIRKGVWIIDANHVITPIASDYKFDERGRAISAAITSQDGRLTYKFSSVAPFMGSDYAERPINASYLFKDSKGNWRPGTPTDRETHDMIQNIEEYFRHLTGPRLGEMPKNASMQQKDVIASVKALNAHGEGDMRQARQNIATLQTALDSRMRLITKESLAYDQSMPSSIRFRKRIVNFLERASRGSIHDVDARLQEWYASQAYARIALETYSEDFKKRRLQSEEVKASLDAKDRLYEARSELGKLMSLAHLGREERSRISQLREAIIPSYVQNVHTMEAIAKNTQKSMGWPDRDIKRVADSYVPFYNVAEQTVMRDPRITYGSAYGLAPAMMSGYQTGQFVSERPQMWAGYSLLPGDRLANFLTRPSYWAAMAFGMHTRTFFTRMTGYTTIYHLDPERGLTNTHEQNFIEAVQSVFKPWQSFDWFTRFMKMPNVRTKYVDEYGLSLKEETAWVGRRTKMPLSFKYSGVEDNYDVDRDRAKLLGLDIDNEMRQKKIGLTFREEFSLWNKRYQSSAAEEGQQILSNLRNYLNSSTDPDERRMIKSRMRELEDIAKTRPGLNIPIVRDIYSSIFRQGYYAVEDRSGYDVSAQGGAHRPSEMVWAFHDTIKTAPTPGMYYTDFNDRFQMFPYVTMTLANPLPGSSLATMAQRVAPERLNDIGTKAYLENSGVGRNVRAEALRDVYRRETPIFLEFVKVEQMRQMFQIQNSPYIFPLAPAFILGYHMLIKPNIPRLNNAPWSSAVPKYDYQFFYNPARLSPEQAEARQKMDAAKIHAGAHGHADYACPTHGIILSIGQACPLCKSQEQVEIERKQSGIMRKVHKLEYSLKNWGLSALSPGSSFPGNYFHYQNQTTCPTHGIMHEHGTACPLCVQDRVNDGSFSQQKADTFNIRIKDLNRQIEKTYTDLSLPQEQRARLVEQKIEEKHQALADFQTFLHVDQRDVPYKHRREYIQAQLKKTAEYDKRYGYKINFD